MSKEIEKINEKFEIPIEMIEEIYDNSGDGNIKGIFLCTLNEDGELKMYEKYSHPCIEKSFVFDLSQYIDVKTQSYGFDVGEQ